MPPLLILALATLLPSAAALATDWRGYARTDAFAYSEPVSIEAAVDDWKGHFHGGKRQWAYLWAEAGVRTEQFSLGALYRHEISLRFDKETAEAYHLISNDLPLPQGRHYALYLDAMRFSATGLRSAWTIRPTTQLQLTLGASLLEARHLQRGELTGSATVVAENEYAFHGQVDYRYEEDLLFDRAVERPDGRGWSLDLALRWSVPEKLDIALHITDAAGKIQWQDVPYTLADARSQRTGVDDKGFVKVDPVLNGTESYEGRYIQRLQPRYQLRVSAPLAETYQGQARVNCQYGHCLYGVGLERKRLSILYWPQFRGVELRFAGSRYYVALISDALQLSEMQVLSLSFGVNL